MKIGSWLMGGGKNQVKSKDEQVQDVLNQFQGTRRGDSLDITVTVLGNPDCKWSVQLPPNYPQPGGPPQFSFVSSLAVEHPLLGKRDRNMQRVTGLECLNTWNTQTTLMTILNALTYEFGCKEPGVHHPGEQLFIMEKGVQEPMGCSFLETSLQSVAPGGPAYRCGMSNFMGWTCTRVNNRTVSRTDDIKQFAPCPRIVLNLRQPGVQQGPHPVQVAPTQSFSQPPPLGEQRAGSLPQQQQQQKPPAPVPVEPAVPQRQQKQAPPIPISFDVDGLDLGELQTLSTNETALRGFLEKTDFAKGCKGVSEEAAIELAELESEAASKKALLEAHKVEHVALEAKAKAAQEEQVGLNQRVAAVREATQPHVVRAALMKEAGAEEALSMDLEKDVTSGASDPTKYIAARTRFHKLKTQAEQTIQVVS